ncbi:unnamed protein product [Leuciscus chuanchicus]
MYSLEPGQKDVLLEKVLTRLPGLMFDILSLMEVTQQPDPDPEGLHWCVCGHCRDMVTDMEKVCCRQTPEHCISNMAYMAYYILDEGVLRLARGAWNDIFAINDHQEPGEEQRQYRHSAYHLFVLWQHGRLGIGNRVVIPSCCVWKIRDSFPDPRGQYTGFRSPLMTHVFGRALTWVVVAVQRKANQVALDRLPLEWSCREGPTLQPPTKNGLLETLCKIREDEEQVILVAPHWPTWTWFSELELLVTAPPWPIPLRKDLLSQKGAPYGTLVLIFGTYMCGFWMGRGRFEYPTTSGGSYHHFRQSLVHETCLCVEVEPLHHPVLFSPRRPQKIKKNKYDASSAFSLSVKSILKCVRK